ncbi:hypothetical protein Bca4012_001507 [Brassica carinata]
MAATVKGSTVKPSTAAMEIEEGVDELDRCAVEEVLELVSYYISFINQFFWYRRMPLSITGISAQIAVVPLGHLMARVLPNKKYLEGSRWEFNMNPGPFNIKEHVMITIFANSGAGTVYATHILSAIKLYYKRSLPFLQAFLIMITTQFLGFGWAGLFRKHLVEPSNLVQVSLFSPNSVLVNQLGSGEQGLGIGAVGIDWATISSYLGSPLASPIFATINVTVGFVVVVYVVTPICYWLNLYNAKTYPIFSSGLFMRNGSSYDVLSIIDNKFHLDRDIYAKTGPIHMSTFFAVTYGLGFATLSATMLTSDLWKQTRGAFKRNKNMDIHTRIMKKNYKEVPMWWFLVILVINIALIVFISVYYNATVQLPWWGVLLACAIAVVFTPLIGVIVATTNQAPGLNVITEYVIGYIYPERPVANMCFKVYGYISMTQALTFIQDFKLGLYMKIPPRSMYMAQYPTTLRDRLAHRAEAQAITGFLSVHLRAPGYAKWSGGREAAHINIPRGRGSKSGGGHLSRVYTGTAWWLMAEIPHLCDKSLLPPDSEWTCPMDRVFFDASVIWGLVGPRAIAPFLVWLASKAFPAQKWISNIHFPVILGATAMMPPAMVVNFTSWCIVAFIFGHFVFKYKREWWKKYNYVLSGGLDAGTAFMTILIFLALGRKGIGLV